MMIAKQMDIRSNIKKFFDIAFEGEPVIVPRKQGRNVVIISENEYNRMSQAARLSTYALSVSETAGNGRILSTRTGDLKAHNLIKLNRIRSMNDNWNGNGAPALPPAVIERVESLINELVIQPEIFPTALGTIQLEYDNSRRDHMEIEISDDSHAEVFMIKYNGEESYETIPITADALNKRIGDFYG
ncbi:MAG: hypothetical protein IK123_10495 [Lachnospiraceae bacterium]|nr:hypothetical protein [Lachnospiraceae bacterium]